MKTKTENPQVITPNPVLSVRNNFVQHTLYEVIRQIDSEKGIYGIKIVKPNSTKYFYFSESLQEKQLQAKARTVLKKLQEAKEIQEIISYNFV